jgi:2-desacetyl-2-hydroxyethyl bacteriochlorophyllide A dehydrogenase
MKALICSSPFHFDIIDVNEPRLEEDKALIKIKNIGICGTDLHAFEGTQPYFTYPRILGHELAGEIIDIAGSRDFKKGELVTFIPYLNCGQCQACVAGKTNCCETLKVYGVHIDGGMTEYLSVPSRLLVKIPGIRSEYVALIEPLAIAAHAVRRASVQRDDTVLVAGAGPIGIGIMQFAKRHGATVIAADVNEARLNSCRERFNVDGIIDVRKQQVEGDFINLTQGLRPSVVFDATGNLQALQNGFKYMSHGGKYVLVGLQLKDISFSHPEFHKREGTLMSSRNATREDFEEVVAAIASGDINPGKMITHRVKFDSVKDEFKSWLNPDSGVIKVVVEID